MKVTLSNEYNKKAAALEYQRTNEVEALNGIVKQLEIDLAQRGNDRPTKTLLTKIALLERQLQEQAAMHETTRAVRRSGSGPRSGDQNAGGDALIGFLR